MASIPRIMVVDSTRELGTTLRSVLSMLDRQYILLELPTTEAALTEMRLSNVDLVVTTYATDGTMNGIEFGARAIREQAGTPIVIVASPGDPLASELGDELHEKPFRYVPYPPEDRFIKEVRFGLDGVEVAAAQETPAGFDLGPIPTLDVDKARNSMISTIRELSATGCLGGIIADRIGRIVVDEGATGYVDKAMIAALIGPSFANAAKIGPQIGGHGWSMKYFDGERYDLFALALGLHYFMFFVFDGTKRPAFGSVTRYGREGADKVIELLGEAAWSYTARAEPVVKVPAKKSTSPLPAVAAKADAKPAPEPPKPRVDEPIFEPIKDLNLDVLLGQKVDDGGMGDLFSLDQLGEEVFGIQGDEVSFEEAQNMGLLDA